MENGVDMEGVREFQFVGDGGDDMGDGVGAKETRLQFFGGTGSLGC